MNSFFSCRTGDRRFPRPVGAAVIFYAVTAIAIAAVAPAANAAAAMDLFGNLREVASASNPGQIKKLEQIKKERTTAHMQLVDIDLSALAGASVQIRTSATEVQTFIKTRIEEHGPSNFTWFGKLVIGEGSAILVVRNSMVTGTLNIGVKSFKIMPVGEGGHAVVEIDTAGYPADHPEIAADSKRTGKPGTTTTTPTTTTTTTATITTSPTAVIVNGETMVDVLVVYPPTVAAAVTDVVALAKLAVAESNQAYLNSSVNIQMNLVGATQISYVETGKDYNTMLSDVTAMSSVQLLRDSVHADVVVMLSENTSWCGMAWYGPSVNYAYGVVNRHCATGYYSFAHEIGHMFGLLHDPISSPGTTPFAYGHGYQSTSSSPSWRTIMAYNCAVSCARIQYFSIPNKNYNGLAMGTPTVSDNARVLNEQAAIVGAFRTQPVP